MKLTPWQPEGARTWESRNSYRVIVLLKISKITTVRGLPKDVVISPSQFLQGQLRPQGLQRPDGDLGDSEGAQEGRDGSGKAQV